jgi:general secretion pathway protein F/type IV pilus assembly protein PilC
MPEFTYTARTVSGENVTGTLTAASKRDMLAALAEQALFPIRVDSREPARPRWQRSRKVKPQLISTTLTQLADLLQNGVPLLSALNILAEQSAQRNLAEVLMQVRDRVTDGTALDVAMAEHPQVFGELTVSMVRAGTEGAFLEDALKRTASFLELQQELKSRVVGAMTYPIILSVVGTLVTIFLMVFLVPKFAGLFERLETQGGGLPLATVVLLGISATVKSYGILIAAAIAGLVYWLKKWMASDRGRLLTDRWKLKIPVAGPVFLNYSVSRFCRVLGTLLRNGVPLLRALEISSDSAGNRVLSDAIRASAENVSSGETLARPLAACGLIPKHVMAMITIAEESNNLDNVLVTIADGIDRDTSRMLDIMVRLVEPALLLVMGGMILFMLVALLMPVFEMSSQMG